MGGPEFHLRMYAMAEELEYSLLQQKAHTSLVNTMMLQGNKITPLLLKDFVAITYSYAPYESKICRDEDHALQVLAVAAAIYQDHRVWSSAAKEEFEVAVKDYTLFLTDREIAKIEHENLLTVLTTGQRNRKPTLGSKTGAERTGRGEIRKKSRTRSRKTPRVWEAAKDGEGDGMELDELL